MRSGGPLQDQLEEQRIGREAILAAERNKGISEAEAKAAAREEAMRSAEQQRLEELIRQKDIAAKQGFLSGLRRNHDPITDMQIAAKLNAETQQPEEVDIDEEMILGPNGEPIRIDPDGTPIGNARPAPTMPPVQGGYPPMQRQMQQQVPQQQTGLSGYNIGSNVGNQQTGSGNYITDYAKRLLES